MPLTADNPRRRQLPRVVRATLLNAAKSSIVKQATPVGFDVAEELKRGGTHFVGRKACTVISLANPTQVTSAAHGLATGDVVVFDGTNSTPKLDGPNKVTVIDANNFTVPVNVTVAGNAGFFTDGVLNLRNLLLRGQASPAT